MGQPGSIETRLAIANPASSNAVVNLELATLKGSPIGTTVSVTVPAGGQVAPSISTLFPTAPLTFQGFLKVTSTSPIAITGLRDRYNERGDYLMTTMSPRNEGQSYSPNSGLVFRRS